MKNCLVIGLSLFLNSFSLASDAPSLNPAWAKPVAQCKKPTKLGPSTKIWFFKQWHLAPASDTRDIEHSKLLPQYQNQLSLYRQLDQWIGAGQIKTLIAEGCSGEINSKTSLTFNGWNIPALKSQLKNNEYESILTSIPIKLEAKYGEHLLALCGDDDGLIKKNELAFSDARGEVGFLTRLEQYKDDSKHAKNYLDGVIELYHMPKDTTVKQGISRLNLELSKSVTEIEKDLELRNEHLMGVIEQASNKTPAQSDVAVVFGGAHAAGILALLEKSGFNCSIVEPVGYAPESTGDDEVRLLQRLEKLVRRTIK